MCNKLGIVGAMPNAGQTRLCSTDPSTEAVELAFPRAIIFYVRFEVLTVETMKNVVFWDLAPVYTISTRRHIPEDDILHTIFYL
jgi:hypothetical protein